MLEFSRTWLPYLYLYGAGGFIFFVGMVIILRSRSLKKERKRHNFWHHILIFGFFYYMGIHGAVIHAALGNYIIMFLIILAMVGLLAWTLISPRSESEKNRILERIKTDESVQVALGIVLLFILIILNAF